MTPTREEIVAEARKWIGVKFKRGGRDKMGLDCVGLLTVVGRGFGYVIEDVTSYDFEPKPNLFLDTIRRQTEDVPGWMLKSPLPGQIVLLKQSIYPMHCGIIGRNSTGPTVINANLLKRKVVEQPIVEWQKDLLELREYPGVA